jgi:hypothetical protein
MESATQRERKRLKQLIEIYALQARRLTEALAVLGGLVTAQKQIDQSMIQIKSLSRLVEQAGADLFAFVAVPPENLSNQ